jgi:hypothetical protein
MPGIICTNAATGVKALASGRVGTGLKAASFSGSQAWRWHSPNKLDRKFVGDEK